MSSRLLDPDEEHEVEPMAWRTLDADEAGGAVVRAGAPQPLFGTGTDMERRIEKRISEAHAAGLREGEAEGRNRAAAELQPVIERLGRSLVEIGGLRARLRREAEKDLVALALRIAHRVLRREVAVDPEALHGLVLGALEKLESQEVSRARVHPAHAALVTSCLQQLANGGQVEVVADPSCAPGTVILETERGSLDASIESQLREIERGLADRLQHQA